MTTVCDCPGCAWGIDAKGNPIYCVRVLARERVLQLLSVEIEIESDDSDPPYRAALHEAFDALCERWRLRLESGS